MAFTCDTNYCFNGGICVTGIGPNNQSFCDCPNTEFQNDFSFYHDPNCVLPSNFYLGQFLYFVVLGIIITLYLGRVIVRNKTKLRRIAIFCWLGNFSIWLYSLSIYLQGGAFEAGAFFMGCCLFTCTVFAVNVITLHVQILETVDKLTYYKKFVRALHVTTAACFVGIFMVAISKMVLSRSPNYNAAAVAEFFSIAIWNTIYVSEIVFFATRLINEMTSLQQSLREIPGQGTTYAQWERVKGQLRFLRTGLILYYVSLVTGILPLVVVHFIIGSVPYAFILVFLCLNTPTVLFAGTVALVRKPNNNGAKPKSDISTDVNAVTPAIQNVVN